MFRCGPTGVLSTASRTLTQFLIGLIEQYEPRCTLLIQPSSPIGCTVNSEEESSSSSPKSTATSVSLRDEDDQAITCIVTADTSCEDTASLCAMRFRFPDKFCEYLTACPNSDELRRSIWEPIIVNSIRSHTGSLPVFEILHQLVLKLLYVKLESVDAIVIVVGDGTEVVFRDEITIPSCASHLTRYQRYVKALALADPFAETVWKQQVNLYFSSLLSTPTFSSLCLAQTFTMIVWRMYGWKSTFSTRKGHTTAQQHEVRVEVNNVLVHHRTWNEACSVTLTIEQAAKDVLGLYFPELLNLVLEKQARRLEIKAGTVVTTSSSTSTSTTGRDGIVHDNNTVEMMGLSFNINSDTAILKQQPANEGKSTSCLDYLLTIHDGGEVNSILKHVGLRSSKQHSHVSAVAPSLVSASMQELYQLFVSKVKRGCGGDDDTSIAIHNHSVDQTPYTIHLTNPKDLIHRLAPLIYGNYVQFENIREGYYKVVVKDPLPQYFSEVVHENALLPRYFPELAGFILAHQHQQRNTHRNSSSSQQLLLPHGEQKCYLEQLRATAVKHVGVPIHEAIRGDPPQAAVVLSRSSDAEVLYTSPIPTTSSLIRNLLNAYESILPPATLADLKRQCSFPSLMVQTNCPFQLLETCVNHTIGFDIEKVFCLTGISWRCDITVVGKKNDKVRVPMVAVSTSNKVDALRYASTKAIAVHFPRVLQRNEALLSSYLGIGYETLHIHDMLP
eukprot:PhF_6_TR32400/c0_g1_i1/m.48072